MEDSQNGNGAGWRGQFARDGATTQQELPNAAQVQLAAAVVRAGDTANEIATTLANAEDRTRSEHSYAMLSAAQAIASLAVRYEKEADPEALAKLVEAGRNYSKFSGDLVTKPGSGDVVGYANTLRQPMEAIAAAYDACVEPRSATAVGSRNGSAAVTSV